MAASIITQVSRDDEQQLNAVYQQTEGKNLRDFHLWELTSGGINLPEINKTYQVIGVIEAASRQDSSFINRIPVGRGYCDPN